MVELDDEFSAFRNENIVSNEQRVVYFINSFIAALVPVYLYHAIFSMSFDSYMIVYGSVTLFAAIVLTFAYNNVYRVKRLKLSATREHMLIPKTKQTNGLDRKKVLAAKRESQAVVTSHEATALSIMYNNAVFLVSMLAFSFIIFKNVPLVYNYIVSVSLAAGFTTFLSTSSKH
ncbi:hypothetical protein CYY_005116 [Polysphondylium violaceum]|uniref:Translocon-associated protein subunit gamma n=1 Tax=Polysphondylium violaceum TaxID=133409 RepID=A0A8J4PU06_9MYCE|nr:hypothetical protein CYY_005116 [Polysphondylium violaceum]